MLPGTAALLSDVLAPPLLAKLAAGCCQSFPIPLACRQWSRYDVLMTTAFTTHLKVSMRFLAPLLALFMAMSSGTRAAAPSQETSVDLYCKSLSFGFMDTYRFLNSRQDEAKLNKAGVAMEQSCRNAPTIAPMKMTSMKPSDIATMSCLGFATGAQLAHQVGRPAESYSVLSKRRDFALGACQKDPKRFQDDVFKRGPDFVLTQKY